MEAAMGPQHCLGTLLTGGNTKLRKALFTLATEPHVALVPESHRRIYYDWGIICMQNRTDTAGRYLFVEYLGTDSQKYFKVGKQMDYLYNSA